MNKYNNEQLEAWIDHTLQRAMRLYKLMQGDTAKFGREAIENPCDKIRPIITDRMSSLFEIAQMIGPFIDMAKRLYPENPKIWALYTQVYKDCSEEGRTVEFIPYDA